eukprot:scaffold3609_cov65-Cyclotella_meneghiniana.AAC.4
MVTQLRITIRDSDQADTEAVVEDAAEDEVEAVVEEAAVDEEEAADAEESVDEEEAADAEESENEFDDEQQARINAIKSAFEQCKNPQTYSKEDIERRYMYGLKILRTAQLAKGSKTKARWLQTLLPIPSNASLPGYGSRFQVTHDQVKRMLFMLCIIHELNRMNENIMFRSLVYLFMTYFKVPDKTKKRKFEDMDEGDIDETDEYDWNNLYFEAEFGLSIKVNMKVTSACDAVITTLKNLSELIGLPKLTNPVMAPFSLIKEGNTIDLSHGWWGPDHQTLKNTMHMREGSRYTVDEGSMSKIKGIVIVEKLSMLVDLFKSMTVEQREGYILMTPRGFRSDMFLYVKSMFKKLAQRELPEFITGDADIWMFRMALSMEKVEVMSMADSCYYNPVTIVSPLLEKVNEDSFTGFSDKFIYYNVGKTLNNNQLRFIREWLEEDSDMLINQGEERKKMLRELYRGGNSYQIEGFEKTEFYKYIIKYIDGGDSSYISV